MGEMAEDMIEGWSCSWCGIYFIVSHGYPVLCKSCQEDTIPEKMASLGLQPAIHKEM